MSKQSFVCISLWQPWASLLVATPRIKTDETRHWPFPMRVIGKPSLIHAAKRPPNDVDGLLAEICAKKWGDQWRSTLPRGGFVGRGEFSSARKISLSDETGRHTAGSFENWICGDFTPGRWAWAFEGEELAKFIPARGQQGWWTASVDLEAGELAPPDLEPDLFR